jgi:glyoxylase-like metal-dependent hydrolase (beta-lactamase superfamily II)
VQTLSAGLAYLDLGFLGRPHAIATVVVGGSGSIALIDPGPTSCLPHLEQGLQSSGLRLSDVSAIVLTHIHLDHAGATGTILRRCPNIEVIVHRRGAPHLTAPEKLVESARRLWGDDMDRLQMGPAVPATAFIDAEGGIVSRVMGQMREDEMKERLEWLAGPKTGTAPQSVVKHLEK